MFLRSEIKSALESLYELEMDLIEPSSDLMMSAVDLMFKHKITMYDAWYLSLAEMFDASLVTADKKLINTGHSCIKSLSEI